MCSAFCIRTVKKSLIDPILRLIHGLRAFSGQTGQQESSLAQRCVVKGHPLSVGGERLSYQLLLELAGILSTALVFGWAIFAWQIRLHQKCEMRFKLLLVQERVVETQ